MVTAEKTVISNANSIVWSPDSGKYAYFSNNSLIVHDVRFNADAVFTGNYSDFRWISDSEILIDMSKELLIIQVETGALRSVISLSDGWIYSKQLSPDKRYILAVTTSNVFSNEKLNIIGINSDYTFTLDNISDTDNYVYNIPDWIYGSRNIFIDSNKIIIPSSKAYLDNGKIVTENRLNLIDISQKSIEAIDVGLGDVYPILIDSRTVLLHTSTGYFTFDLITRDKKQFDGAGAIISVSPQGSYVSYTKGVDETNGCYKGGYSYYNWVWYENITVTKNKDLWVMSSLLNMSVDLSVIKQGSAVTLRGTAADAHFEGYRLEYADSKTPNSWNLISPPSSVSVVNDVFTTWIPPYEGTYNVRLTVWDKAGNVATVQKRVAATSSSLANVYKTSDYFSPNGDGFSDTVELHYSVTQPVHLEFSIVDANNRFIRTIQKNYTTAGNDFIIWDGRDDYGNAAPEGKYIIKIFNFDFPVTVDNTFPLSDLTFSPVKRELPPQVNISQGGGTQSIVAETVVSTDLIGYGFDGNLKNWVLEYGSGDAPQEWFEYKRGDVSLIKKDQVNNPLIDPPQGDVIASFSGTELQWLMGKKLRLTVEDLAGNVVRKVAALNREGAYITKFDDSGFIVDAIPAGIGMHTIAAVAFVKNPIDKIYVQYRADSGWTDAPLPSNDLSRIAINLTNRIDAVRIKIVDAAGNVTLSQELYVGEMFAITELGCYSGIAEINMPGESLTELKFLLDDRIYSVWRGDSIPTGRFKIPILPSLGDEVRMIGVGASGKIYTDKAFTSCEHIGFTLNAVYTEAECGKSSYQAEIKTKLENPNNIPISNKSLTIYKGNDVLATYDLSTGDSPDKKIAFDTIGLPDGSYPFRAVLTYQDLQGIYVIEAKTTLVVEHAFPSVQILSPNDRQEVCPIKVSSPTGDRAGVPVNALIADNAGVWKFALSHGTGENPFTWLPTTESSLDEHGNAIQKQISGSSPANGQIGIMDVTDLPKTTLSLNLKALDVAGNASCVTSTFKLAKPVEITSVNTDGPFISPNGDGLFDSVNASYAISKPASIDIKVFRAVDNPPRPDATPIRTITTGQQYSSGMAAVPWDGRNNAGTMVPDGLYAIVVSASDTCDYTATKWTTVEVDTTPPATSISYPNPPNPLSSGNFIEIKGTATDLHFKNFVLDAAESAKPDLNRAKLPQSVRTALADSRCWQLHKLIVEA